MAVKNYLTDEQLTDYIKGNNITDVNYTVSKMMTTNTNGIEGLPYQFMDTVDRRIPNTKGWTNGAGVGRKYGERIFARLPLLFLTPCEPLFMDDFSDKSKVNATKAILGKKSSITKLINEEAGRYYSVDFNYAEYYKYLNTMLSCLSVYLGLYDQKISTPKGRKSIGKIDWSNELNDDFKTFFSSKENIVFYLDGMESVSESFSNDTTESQLASQINGYSDTVNELKFLFGSGGSLASELMNYGSEIGNTLSSSLEGVASSLAGGIIGSLSNKGVNTVLNGGKIIFPEIWSNSSFDRSYSINMKLRSPDNDSLSIFLNVLKPYCKLLALTLPRNLSKNKNSADILDANSYYSPFLVKAYSKGLFSIDMGIITSLSVTKGAQCCWNDDGLPTQIDITLEIKDLYSHMAMSSIEYIGSKGSKLKGLVTGVVNNTAYMDFLANMAGLNIAQMEVGRRITMAYYLSRMGAATFLSNAFTRFDQSVSRLINKMYNIL